MIGKETLRAAAGFLADRLSDLCERLLGLGKSVKERVAEAVGKAAEEAARAAVLSLLGGDDARRSAGPHDQARAMSDDRRYDPDGWRDDLPDGGRDESGWGTDEYERTPRPEPPAPPTSSVLREGLLAAAQVLAWWPGRKGRVAFGAAVAGCLAVLTGGPALACAAAGTALVMLFTA